MKNSNKDLIISNSNGVYFYLWELDIDEEIKDTIRFLIKGVNETINEKIIVEIANELGFKDFTFKYPNYSQCYINAINTSVKPYGHIQYFEE